VTLTYRSYLRLDELLSLQRPESDEHDEILFIVIHQVYELWFKELLHELDRLRWLLENDLAPQAQGTLKRILTVLKLAVAQTDVLETMTPLDFLSFRDRLETASGSQSVQFRELEFALGIKDARVTTDFAGEERRRLEARLVAPTVWDALLGHLARRGHPIPAGAMERDVTARIAPSEEIQRALLVVYREDPKSATICERFLDLDEGVQEWRYRHVKMVERTIGTRRGTGGSSGVAFLKRTLFDPAFPDLWAVRSAF
jgi:tryptophan 2,3-dioxygenase